MLPISAAAGENSCNFEGDMQFGDINLWFDANRITAIIVIAGQRVTATVDTGVTISFLAETSAQQVEESFRNVFIPRRWNRQCVYISRAIWR